MLSFLFIVFFCFYSGSADNGLMNDDDYKLSLRAGFNQQDSGECWHVDGSRN